MEREATKVIALYPLLDGRGYVDQAWEVGKKRNNPAGDQDEVVSIWISTTHKRAEIHYKDFGEEWLTDHITSIEFKKSNYEENKAKKKAEKERANTERIKQAFGTRGIQSPIK